MTFLTQHLGLSIFDPNLGWNNPAFFRVHVMPNGHKHSSLKPKTGCPLKLSKYLSLVGTWIGDLRLLLEKVLVRPVDGYRVGPKHAAYILKKAGLF